MLSSIVSEPPWSSMNCWAYGRPDPTPRMYRFISSVAEEVPYSRARSFSGIPGPWSEKRIVWPPSRMLIVGSMKYAWM